jgi:hypothetical protein
MVRFMLQLHCKTCGQALRSGLDTYGDIGAEQCSNCFMDSPDLPEILDDDDPYERSVRYGDVSELGEWQMQSDNSALATSS